MNRAIFLDRDGTIIEDPGYLTDPAKVRLLQGAAGALRILQSKGWKLFVVTNQSGVGRGFITPSQMEAVQQRFLDLMAAHGIEITASYLCVHSPEESCECRKPSPFFLERAAAEHRLDLKTSWMIGDREGDILCGNAAGCSTIWLRNELFSMPETLPTCVAANWAEVVKKISDA